MVYHVIDIQLLKNAKEVQDKQVTGHKIWIYNIIKSHTSTTRVIPGQASINSLHIITIFILYTSHVTKLFTIF